MNNCRVFYASDGPMWKGVCGGLTEYHVTQKINL